VTVQSRVGSPSAPAPTRPEPPAPGPLAAARLPLRLTRRGMILLVLASVFYAVVEVVSYRGTYPEQADRERLAALADSGAVRALQGVPHGVDTVGGFVVWDAGWFLALVVSVWAVLATTRVLRAEEDTGRADVVLATPVSARRLLLAQLAVVSGGALVFGLAFTVSLVALDVPVGGSLLFGLGLAGVGVTFVGVGAVAAQLLDMRRRAVGAGTGVLGLLFLVRMLGNSNDERAWLLNVTPFGWLDRLEPFTAARWELLLLFAAAPLLLGGVAVLERGARDTGSARLTGQDRRTARTVLLGGPVAFGWRLTTGTLLAWSVGLLVFGVVMGALVTGVVDLIGEDEQYRQMLEQFGFDVSEPAEGFLAMMAVFFALAYALYAAWRIGALRAEEGSERLEHLLVRGVVRWRWLAASTALAVVAGTVVVLATGAGIWVGARATGTALSAGQAFGPLLATVPLIVLFTGLAVLALGAAPRMTVAVPATLAVLGYVLDFLGPLLDLPQWVLDLSPFRWLPRPPDDAFAPGSALVLTALGVLAAAVGIALFQRRDIAGD
jgi:ABC-2 type transport system permease protein